MNIKEALGQPAPEVLPSHYLLVENRATQHRDPRLVGKFASLAEAHDALIQNNNKRRYLSLVARYPDKSVKSLYSDGSLSGGYGVYSSDRAPMGHYEDHTPELRTYSGAKPTSHADAAMVSEHHYTDLLNNHVADLVLRGGTSPFKENPIGSEPHKFIQQAMNTGDHTPLLVMADYLQEQGHDHLAGLVRKAVQKKVEQVDNLRWSRTLRTGGR